MGILHIVPGIDDVANGMAVVARLIAKEQGNAEVVGLNHGINGKKLDEVWVHGAWLPREWLVCWRTLRDGKRLVRMTHGSLSPFYLKHQSPLKKRLVGPIERFFLRRADVVVATCQAEAEWIRAYEPRVKRIEITDIKRFFKLPCRQPAVGSRLQSIAGEVARPMHLLYLGRRHPLKGVEYLEKAVENLRTEDRGRRTNGEGQRTEVELRIVSDAFGEEKEKVWKWCDVLVLPTLSENFGLVVAEALEHGKRVITTDGAPAWNPAEGGDYGGRLVYLRGFRDGSDAERVSLLKDAICSLVACKP